MSELLTVASQRLSGGGDDDKHNDEFRRLLQQISIIGGSRQWRAAKAMHRLIGGYADAWGLFLRWAPDAVTRLFREGAPPPAIANEDRLRSLLAILPHPSAWRLAQCCRWLYARIAQEDLAKAHARVLLTHGRFVRIAPQRLMMMVIRDNNEQAITIQPVGPDSRMMRVHMEVVARGGRRSIQKTMAEPIRAPDGSHRRIVPLLIAVIQNRLPGDAVWFRFVVGGSATTTIRVFVKRAAFIVHACFRCESVE